MPWAPAVDSATSGEEWLAVIVSVLGVWLTARRSLWNFPFSIASVALYGHIFYTVRLYSDMALQAVFAVTLVYGLVEWLGFRGGDGTVTVSRASGRELVAGIGGGAVVAIGLGWYTARHTDAALPWLDAPLFAGSLVASWWSARRRIENWWLWIVVDCIYVGMYAYKGLELTALLYAAFVALAALGLRRWRAALETAAPGLPAGQAAAASRVD